MVADEAAVAGLVCLGYPFHPPGNPTRTRVKQLENLRTPTLIVQGTRDSFGLPADISSYKLSKQIRIVWIEAGDHSFKPLVRSGRTEAQNVASAIAEVQSFINKCRRAD
jgi:predicted alpha/beta-hydrolase family hydrolase